MKEHDMQFEVMFAKLHQMRKILFAALLMLV
jgi:hypothetical protein